jgi:protein-tyrosine-phosphatase
MKRVLFIGNGNMYRSKFAEAYFNNLGKLECLFMLNTHGMGRYPSSRYPRAYSSNIKLNSKKELNEFSKQVCDDYLLFGNDCFEHFHKKLEEVDFDHVDVIICVGGEASKEFIDENYPDIASKVTYWEINNTEKDNKVKKKIIKILKEKTTELYEDIKKNGKK